jgi:hypothetical protein
MMGNITNRVFDSSGPDGKVRGTPQQIIDKYLLLARDAQLSNDRVVAEGFLQHAEHYTRLLGEAQRENEARRGEGGDWGQGDGDQPGDQSGGPDRSGEQSARQNERQNERQPNDRQPNDRRPNDRQQNDRQQNDRQQNDRQQNDRQQNDRQQNERGQNERGQNERGQNERGRNGHGQPDRDTRAPRPERAPAPEEARGQGPEAGGPRGRDSQADAPGNDPRGEGARGAFDEVIDLQDSDAGEAGLIETPEARAPGDPRPSTGADTPSDAPPQTEAPAKPARRRTPGPRKPRKTAEGGSDNATPGESPNPASAAE